MNKFKISLMTILIIGFVGLGAVSLLLTNGKKDIKGEIDILASYESYDYLVESANKFMEKNKKTKINIIKAYNDEYLSKVKDGLDASTNIIQLDSVDMYKLNKFDHRFEGDKNVVETYKNNFTKGRISEVVFKDEVKGVPLTSRPLVLYVREDMIKSYGYNYTDINTWNDLMRIGEDVYVKSSGKIKLLNATGQDMSDLISLLIMQSIEYGETDSEKIILEVQTFINELKSKNIINTKEGGNFALRISSINGMRELSVIEEKCEWIAVYPPARESGGNKFYVAEGSNLVIVNEDDENSELISEFLAYLTTNTEVAINYVKEGKFFLSYLYTYKDKAIEDSINNFILRSPLVIMSNVVKKAPQIKDYDLYRKVKADFAVNY